MRTLLTSALVAVAVAAAPVLADELCRSRKGGVFLRPSCKKREVRIEFPKGATGDPGPAASPPVRVVDSAGRHVGLFAEPFNEDNISLAVFEVGDRLVSFFVDRTGLVDVERRFYHRAADCSDAPLAFARAAFLVREGFLFGGAGYYAGDPVELVLPAATEFRPGTGGCGSATVLPSGSCCTTDGTFEGEFGPAVQAFELISLGLTPPFHLEP
jgi:hypothetical protein